MSDAHEIYCEHNPSPAKLEVIGVYDWPVWKKEASSFPWTYKEQEQCYILKGRVIVTPDGGAPQEFKRGDLVTFPQGMSCQWEILEDIEKHYQFG
ncbi:MAG: cupin domain-containing protein [Pseudomonadota bacterium]